MPTQAALGLTGFRVPAAADKNFWVVVDLDDRGGDCVGDGAVIESAGAYDLVGDLLAGQRGD